MVDFSDLGGVPVQSQGKIDFSDLGGIPVQEKGLFGQTLKSANTPLPSFKEAQQEPGLLDVSIPDASTVYGAGQLAKGGLALGKMAVNGIGSVFEPSTTLMSAGIKPSTVLKMTPAGENPTAFGQNLEQNLNNLKAITSDPKQTWSNFNSLTQKAGQRVGASLNAIAQAAGPNSTKVNVGEALQPLVDGWVERASGALRGTRNLAKPFEEAHQYLLQKSIPNNGTLSLDDVHGLLQDVGPLTHKGSEAMQAAYSELYGTLAEVQKGMVQKVAQQSGNPALAKNLLSANADYSQFMRLMPDISKAAAQGAVQAGQSLFQQVHGPAIVKGAGLLATGMGLDRLYGR